MSPNELHLTVRHGDELSKKICIILTSFLELLIVARWNKILDEVQEPDCFVLEDSTDDIVY